MTPGPIPASKPNLFVVQKHYKAQPGDIYHPAPIFNNNENYSDRYSVLKSDYGTEPAKDIPMKELFVSKAARPQSIISGGKPSEHDTERLVDYSSVEL